MRHWATGKRSGWLDPAEAARIGAGIHTAQATADLLKKNINLVKVTTDALRRGRLGNGG